MRIVFMGTPEIAATCLASLLAGGHEIAAVITGEDKPRGRKMILTPTAVKALALERGIPVYTPKTLRDEAFLSLLAELAPEVIVVVAYGKILPEAVLRFPKYGCINVHVSLLPKYRGAAPMQRAVMDGEKETGVTLMQMDAGLDTGDILMQSAFPIGAEDTFETVHDTSAALGVFDAEKGEAGKSVNHCVGRAHAHITNCFAFAVNGNVCSAGFEGIGEGFIKKIGLFEIVVIKCAVVKNAFVILFFCGIGFYDLDHICHILCFAMIAHLFSSVPILKNSIV